ncbi:MAG: hypothetical protein ACTSQ8_13500, partial [Candidatus Helarchaeota archaeon]
IFIRLIFQVQFYLKNYKMIKIATLPEVTCPNEKINHYKLDFPIKFIMACNILKKDKNCPYFTNTLKYIKKFKEKRKKSNSETFPLTFLRFKDKCFLTLIQNYLKKL